MINKVLEAKKLLNSKTSISKISVILGMDRRVIQPMVDLYDALEEKPISSNSNEYVCIKKKRHMMKSIKIQHRIADMRNLYINNLRVVTNKRKVLRKYIDDAEEIHDLKSELKNKQKVLNVVSSNLQTSEDYYELLKKEMIFHNIMYFIGGSITTLIFLTLYKMFIINS